VGWSPYRQTGLTHHRPSASVKGYTLVTPFNGNASYLLDMDGAIVQAWHFPELRPFYSRLLPNGNLLTIGTDTALPAPNLTPGTIPSFEENVRRLGGSGSHLVESDWAGNRVWQYAQVGVHHDFVRLANGNTLMPVNVELPAALARQVRGGQRERNLPPMVSDDFLEVDAGGREVRRIHLWQLLDPRRNPICPLERRIEWTHTNSLAVTPDGDIVFSCRNVSRVGIVAASGDKLLWQYGNPNILHQHHATVLANGNIQIFDNGMHRVGTPYSQVLEVNPKDSSVAWRYTAEPLQQFFSGHISGAERLAGGNVLVCEGAAGRVFEITRAGEVVWEWVTPFANRTPAGALITSIFRAHRYAPDDPALAGRELDPARYRDLNRLHRLVA
jgi:hypothetical protein